MNEMKVLLVEDNPVDVFMVRLALERSTSAKFKVDSVDRLGAAIERANSMPTNVILLDLGLPDAQGLEALVRARAAIPNIPILVLSGLDDEEVAIQAVQQGAQDYLLKGTTLKEVLACAICSAIERHRAQEQLARHALDLPADVKKGESRLQKTALIVLLATTAGLPAFQRVEAATHIVV